MTEPFPHMLFKPLIAADMLLTGIEIYKKYGKKINRSYHYYSNFFYNDLEYRYSEKGISLSSTSLMMYMVATLGVLRSMTISESLKYHNEDLLISAFNFVRIWGALYNADYKKIEAVKLQYMTVYGTSNKHYIDIAFDFWDIGLFPIYIPQAYLIGAEMS